MGPVNKCKPTCPGPLRGRAQLLEPGGKTLTAPCRKVEGSREDRTMTLGGAAVSGIKNNLCPLFSQGRPAADGKHSVASPVTR